MMNIFQYTKGILRPRFRNTLDRASVWLEKKPTTLIYIYVRLVNGPIRHDRACDYTHL